MRDVYLYAGIGSFLVGVVVASIFSITPFIALLGITISLALSVCAFFERTLLITVLAICVFASSLGSLRVGVVEDTLPSSFSARLDQKVTYAGTIVAVPDLRESTTRYTVQVTEGGEKIRILAVAPPYPPHHIGEEIRVEGVLSLPKDFETDGGRTFAYSAFLKKDGILALVQPARVTSEGESKSWWLKLRRVLDSIRVGFGKSLAAALPEPESSLAGGLIVGGKQGLGKELLDAFTTAGMLQIIVLSGYNVMIIADIVMRALARLPRTLATVLAMSIMTLFVLAAGTGASAIRALIMALFALFARATGRTYEAIRMLFVALVLMTLYEPLQLVWDPGLQFSFLATLGLMLGTDHVASHLHFLRSPTLIEMVATTLAAQIAVLPILLWQTGNLSIVSIFANLAVMSVIPLAMALSAFAGLVSFLCASVAPLIPLIVGMPAYLILTYICHVAIFAASVPLANVIIPQFPFWIVVASYGLLAYLLFHLHTRTPPTPIRVGGV